MRHLTLRLPPRPVSALSLPRYADPADRFGQSHELRAIAVRILALRLARSRDHMTEIRLATEIRIPQQQSELGHRGLKLKVHRRRRIGLRQYGLRNEPALIPVRLLVANLHEQQLRTGRGRRLRGTALVTE